MIFDSTPAVIGHRGSGAGDRPVPGTDRTVAENSLDSMLAAPGRLVVVLAHVRDPGNAGTVIRAADAAGASAVVITDASVDPYNAKCVRASAGRASRNARPSGSRTRHVNSRRATRSRRRASSSSWASAWRVTPVGERHAFRS